MVCRFLELRELAIEDHEGTFWSDTNILDHDFGDSYRTICICQIPSKCTIKFMSYMYVNYTSIKLPQVNLIKRYFERVKAQPSELIIGQKK